MDIILRQRLKENDLIQTIQKLRTERSPQICHRLVSCLLTDGSVFLNALQQISGANIRSQDQDRVFEINGSALGIRDTSIIQYL